MKNEAEDERDPAALWEIARGFHAYLIEAFGYPYKPSTKPFDREVDIQVVDGNPRAAVLTLPGSGGSRNSGTALSLSSDSRHHGLRSQ